MTTKRLLFLLLLLACASVTYAQKKSTATPLPLYYNIAELITR